MKPSHNKAVINRGLFLLFFILFSGASLAKVAKMSAAWELWYPYQYRNSEGQLVGIDIQYFKEVMRRAKMDYSLDEIPWNIHLQLIKQGQLDVAFAASRNQEREKFAYFSIPYRVESIRIFVLRGGVDNFSITNLHEIANTEILIGIEKGYFYGHEFERLFQQKDFRKRFILVKDIEENIRLLINGKINAVLADPLTMEAFSVKYQLDDYFEAYPLIIFSDNVYFMFSKQSVSIETVNKINVIINELKQSGADKDLLKNNLSFQQVKK